MFFNKKYLYTLSLFFYLYFCNTSLSFEGFVQPKNRIFIVPYVSYGWNNLQNKNGSFSNSKIQKQYFGLMEEYGLTERLTIGSDAMFSANWITNKGTLKGNIKNKSFALQTLNLFARYLLYNGERLKFNVYASVNTPSFGKGNGVFDTFKPFNKWGNMLRFELGYLFTQTQYMSFNIGYKANYNAPADMLEFKITYYLKLPYNFLFYFNFKKQAFISKNKHTYGFSQNGFKWRAFDLYSNSGLVAVDLFFGYKIKDGLFAVIQYTKSLHSSIFGNKNYKINQNTIWLEIWWNFKV